LTFPGPPETSDSMGKTKFKPVEDVKPEVVDEAEELEEQMNDGEVEEETKKEEEEAPKSFEELGLDSRLIRALTKKGIEKPTLIQQSAIPYILVMKLLKSLPFKKIPLLLV